MARKLTNLDTTPGVGTVSNDSLTSELKIGIHRKNILINGNFDVWQRATSQTSSGYGSADRWNNSNTGAVKTTTQEVFSLGQTDVPNNPKFFLRTDVTTAGVGVSDFAIAYQQIENVETFSGKTITLSFWAKADATRTFASEFSQFFGTGGSPSTSNIGLGVTQHTLTTSWQKFTVTTTLPSVSGKTLGTTAGTDYLQLVFWFDAGTTFNARTLSLGHQTGTFDIAQVQLEENDTATNFEYISLDDTLVSCYRYYFKNLTSIQYGHSLNNNIFRRRTCEFPTHMRVIPTVTVTTPTVTGGTFNSQVVSSVTTTGFLWIGDVSVITAHCHIKGYTADAEF